MVIDAGIRITPEVISVVTNGARALKDFKDHEEPERFRSSLAAADVLIAKLKELLDLIKEYLRGDTTGALMFSAEIEKSTKDAVGHFESMLGKELADLPLFCVEEKGNLALPRLIKGASQGYAAFALVLLNDFVKGEI